MARKSTGAKAPGPALSFPPEVRSSRTAASLENFRHLATYEKNPLYVWEAIELCAATGTTLPDWCLNYIQATAILIRDIRNRHFDAEAFRTDANGYLKHRKAYRADHAIKAIPKALQLEGKGWNAFTKYAAAERKIHDTATYDAGTARPKHLSNRFGGTDAAIEAIRVRHPIEKKESVLRRVRQGRSLLPPTQRAKPKGD